MQRATRISVCVIAVSISHQLLLRVRRRSSFFSTTTPTPSRRRVVIFSTTTQGIPLRRRVDVFSTTSDTTQPQMCPNSYQKLALYKSFTYLLDSFSNQIRRFIKFFVNTANCTRLLDFSPFYSTRAQLKHTNN